MLPGDKIGRYEIVRRLAAGGMAEIFLAKLRGEAGFEKEVVLKRILPQWSIDRDFVAMLIDEAKIAVQLNHPNIVQVYELAREGEVYYISMEYLNGVDARRLLQKAQAEKARVPVEASLFIICELLEALAYAHSRKDASGLPLEIIHRDISPQNILLSFEGAVKLADFGIAKAASRSQETVTGVLKGKFAYMSPEQANQEVLDHRSDLFSLTVVFYELLTGERLFYRGSDLDTLDRVRRCDVSFSPQALKIIPTALQEVLRKGLAKRPEDRFKDAAAFREVLIKIARRSGKEWSRLALSEYLTALFGDERKTIPENGPQPTSILPEGGSSSSSRGRTSLLLDQTRTAFKGENTATPEVLAQGIDPATHVEPPSLVRREFRKGPWWAAAGLLVLVILGVAAGSRWIHLNNINKSVIEKENTLKIKPSLEVKIRPDSRPTPPEIPPPVQPDQAITAAVPMSETLPAETAPVVDLKPSVKPVLEKGYISVQAIPWGTVTVDGGRGRETPVKRLSLSPGRHNVRVSYAPEGTAVSTSVRVEPGREIVCFAKLREGKKITCSK